MQDLIEILSAMASKKAEVDNPFDLFLDLNERIVKAAAGALGAKPDEIAILMLTSDGKALRFSAPRKFTDLGLIPITKRDSIAVGVLTRKEAEANNAVPQVKHVAIFESVRLKERALPIQKMVTVPILHDGEPIGVAQVSRKGESPIDAGPDFTSADVKKVQTFFGHVAQYLAATRPDRF